jgi:AcrR family transcriptional regulator
MSDTTASPAGADRGLSRRELTDTHGTILEAARNVLLQDGYAKLSTRRVAELADVPLSQIHYHFGSKQQLILGVLRAENARLLERQTAMYQLPEPLWKQWDRACDFLEVDLESGYVRILQEMVAAGWSDAEVAAEVRAMLGGWLGLLTAVATREAERVGGLGPFTPAEIGALMGVPFLGAESTILLGFTEAELPIRSALRKVGAVIRRLEEEGDFGGDGDA